MNRRRDCIVIGMALFAMFFGAGNLIFPPQLGLFSGNSWLEAILGFFTTDVVLSVFAIIAIAKAGGTFSHFGDKVGKGFSLALGIFLMLTVGPLLAIPRTGAVSYEMGFAPIFGGNNQLIFTFVYFALAFFFVYNPKGVLDKIGKWLTPTLLISLATIIIVNIISPIGTPVDAITDNVYTYAFLQGFQTVDGIAAVMFSSIILLALKEKGYTGTKTQISMTIQSSIVAFSIIGFVYGGLIYLGATGSGIVSTQLSRTDCFVALVKNVFGNAGIWVVAVTVLFACFTTTAGLIATVSEYFMTISNNKLTYRFNVVVITIISFVLANLGVTNIVKFAGPMLNISYPVLIVLVILNLIDNGTMSKNIYRGTIFSTLIFTTFFYLGNSVEPIKAFFYSFPFVKYEMGWVLPAIAGAISYPLIIKIYKLRLNTKRVK
ncbi:MAG: branched-chain amino acid transport system II carrier protein [Bacteroidales bacterium]|nr:branched-chain amino acid transport system II carrier protein [Bacteroidales bacterium]